MSSPNPSPLRYPGGKTCLARPLETILYSNDIQGCTYVEPFAGGAGAGLKLLMDGHVSRIVINDIDRAVYSFWRSVMNHADDLVDRIETTPLSIEEWQRQRDIYRSAKRCSIKDIGFAAFYLNRCNRSGIIKNGGPIGGTHQEGQWKIDARFNRAGLVSRIREISSYGDRVTVLQKNAVDLLMNLTDLLGSDSYFIYADPPYYNKGRELYLNHYNDSDHSELSRFMQSGFQSPWVMTYDDVPRIRELYKDSRISRFALRYSAHRESAQGSELLITPQSLTIPGCTLFQLGGKSRGPHSMN